MPPKETVTLDLATETTIDLHHLMQLMGAKRVEPFLAYCILGVLRNEPLAEYGQSLANLEGPRRTYAIPLDPTLIEHLETLQARWQAASLGRVLDRVIRLTRQIDPAFSTSRN